MSTGKERYHQYLKSRDWEQKKASKLKASCAICGSTKNLDTHHLNYRNWYDVQKSDLRKLCHGCHFLVHDLMKSGKLVFTSDNHHSRFALMKAAVKKELGLSGKNLFRK